MKNNQQEQPNQTNRLTDILSLDSKIIPKWLVNRLKAKKKPKKQKQTEKKKNRKCSRKPLWILPYKILVQIHQNHLPVLLHFKNSTIAFLLDPLYDTWLLWPL